MTSWSRFDAALRRAIKTLRLLRRLFVELTALLLALAGAVAILVDLAQAP